LTVKINRISEQFGEALDSRVVIEQAKGMFAAERGISIGKAFELLRSHARSRRTPSAAEASNPGDQRQYERPARPPRPPPDQRPGVAAAQQQAD
jgi:ANTAR domain